MTIAGAVLTALGGPIAGTALKAVGSIVGGIIASRQARKAEREQKAFIQEREADNQDWYDREYNVDSTQRADAQRLLTMTSEAIKNRNKRAEGMAAVGGATEESVAAEKQINAQALANTASSINEQGQARKDQIEDTYQARKDALNSDRQLLAQQTNAQKQSNIASAISGISGAAGGILGNATDKPEEEANKPNEGF